MSLATAPSPRFVAGVNDNTGATETIATAGTPLLLIDPLFVQIQNDIPSTGASVPGFAFDVATGLVTLRGGIMAGKYRVTFTPARVTGTNAGVKIFHVAKNGAVAGFQSRDVSAATAVDTSMGPAIAYLDIVAGDTIGVLCDVGSNGHNVVVKAGVLEIERIQ